MSEKIYTTADAAKARGCNRSRIAQIISALGLTPKKFGRDLALTPAEYTAILAAPRTIGRPKTKSPELAPTSKTAR